MAAALHVQQAGRRTPVDRGAQRVVVCQWLCSSDPPPRVNPWTRQRPSGPFSGRPTSGYAQFASPRSWDIGAQSIAILAQVCCHWVDAASRSHAASTTDLCVGLDAFTIAYPLSCRMLRPLCLILSVSTLRGDDSLRHLSCEGGARGANEDVDRMIVLQLRDAPHDEASPRQAESQTHLPADATAAESEKTCGHQTSCGQLCFHLHFVEADVSARFSSFAGHFRNVACALSTFCDDGMCEEGGVAGEGTEVPRLVFLQRSAPHRHLGARWAGGLRGRARGRLRCHG